MATRDGVIVMRSVDRPPRLRVLRACICLTLIVVASAACVDEASVRRETEAESEVKKKATADQAAKVRDGLKPIGELRRFEDVVVDAGSRVAFPPLQLHPPKALEQPEPATLARAWEEAKRGDFVELSCAHFVNRFGNRVRRRVQASLQVVSADPRAVVVRMRATGTEEHDSTRPEVKRKHWTAKFSSAADLVVLRVVDQELGPPLPARHLAVPDETVMTISKQPVTALCSRLPTVDEDQKKRCVASEPGELYLTAGLVSDVETATGNGCRVTAFGAKTASQKQQPEQDAAQYMFVRRGNTLSRERVIAAAAGVVKVEVQGLRYLRKPEAGSVVFEQRNYAPGVVDARKLQLLDWVLQRVFNKYPVQLPIE